MNLNTFSFSRPESSPNPQFSFWAEFPGIAVLILNALWIGGWYQIAVQSTIQTGWIILLLAVIMLSSYSLARLLNTLQDKPFLQRMLYLVWIFASLLLSLNLIFFNEHLFKLDLLIQQTSESFFDPLRSVSIFWHLFIFLLAILRSILLVRNPVKREQVSKAFRTGVVMLLLSGFAFDSEIPSSVLTVFYGLLFTGLLGLSVSHFVDLAESSSGRLPVYSSQWVVGIVTASFGFVLLAVIAGWLIDETVAGLLAQTALALFMVFSVLVMLILSPILAVILEVSNRIGQALFANNPEILTQVTSQNIEGLRDTEEETIYLMTSMFENSKGILMLVILAVVAILAVILVRWKPWQRRLRQEEGISSTASRSVHPPRNEKRYSPNLWANLRSRLAAARIRDVYRRLMLLCERLKSPRPPAITPLEFLPQMEDLFPECADELQQITHAYLKVRYGELPESREEVAAIMDAWSKIRKTGSQIRKKQN